MKAVVRLKTSSIFLGTVALCLAAGAAPAQQQEQVPPRALEVRLDAPRVPVGAEGPMVVRFTLRNASAAPVTFLKWNTPLDGFTGDLFEVTQEGAPVRYIGAIVKRAEPQPEDYVTLEPGAEVSADVDLAEGYAIADPGRYTVAYRLSLGDALTGRTVEARSPKQRVRLRGPRSNAVTIELAEPRAHRPPVGARRPPADPGAPRAGALAKAPNFLSCSSDQQTQLQEAHTAGGQLATEAVLALTETPAAVRPAASRYRSWFGAFDPAGYDTAVRHFQSIRSVFADQTITLDCSCLPEYQSAYAYVFPWDAYTIHVCNAFWPAPLVGTDSKGGTLIHETSHFDVVAGTDDHAYGQMAARELAIDDPSQALDNADSHEYFAENTPSESMGRAQAWVALSDGTRLGPGARWSDNFCSGQQVCRTGDVNGDGKADLIGFVRTDHLTDDSDVYVALSDGTKFGPARKWHDFFCTLDEVCTVADVNGDGKADLVTFVRTNHGPGDSDVWVALSDGKRFGPGQKWHDFFCTLNEVCAVGDVNGDGKADAIAFVRTNNGQGDSDVWVALSDGTRFGPGRKWHDFFCTLNEVCAVGDVNGDGKADAIAFVRTNNGQGDSDVWVALSDGTRFGPGQKWHDFFCTLNEVCAVGDVNGDGKADVLAFVRTNNGQGDSDVWVALSEGSRFGTGQKWHDFFCTLDEVCTVGDVNGDGKADVQALTRGR